jgi:hypothetical protein
MPRHVAQLVTRLVVDYFNYVSRSVALARRAACHVTNRRLLRLVQCDAPGFYLTLIVSQLG